MPEFDDNQVECMKRIDELRTRLNDRGYQFIDAGPLNKIEQAASNFEEYINRLKGNRLRIKPKPFYRARFPLFLLLLGLLICLLIVWRLYS